MGVCMGCHSLNLVLGKTVLELSVGQLAPLRDMCYLCPFYKEGMGGGNGCMISRKRQCGMCGLEKAE